MYTRYPTKCVTQIYRDLQWPIQGRAPSPPPLFLDQAEARRAEEIFVWKPDPHLSKHLDEKKLKESNFQEQLTILTMFTS